MRKQSPDFTAADLMRVWSLSRDSTSRPGNPGVDKVTALAFKAEIRDNVKNISQQMRRGEYRFSDLYPCFVQKKSGKDRLICIPTVGDRLAQRAVCEYLEDQDRLGLQNGISYGFLRGRGVQSALDQATALRKTAQFVVKVDISKFFDTIDRRIILELIDKNIKSKRVRGILRLVVDMEAREFNRQVRTRIGAMGIRRGYGLRQGMPLSPLLSNLYLRSFDRALGRSGILAVRYVDDIVAFASSKKEAEQIFAFIRVELGKLGLLIPDLDDVEKSSEIHGPRACVEFLGLDIKPKGDGTYVVAIPANRLQKFEAKVRDTASVTECVRNRINISQASKTLDAMLAGLEGTLKHASGFDDFVTRARILKSRAIAELIEEIIGLEAAKNLSSDGRKVLGLDPF